VAVMRTPLLLHVRLWRPRCDVPARVRTLSPQARVRSARLSFLHSCAQHPPPPTNKPPTTQPRNPRLCGVHHSRACG
jgi:hypothetical protein